MSVLFKKEVGIFQVNPMNEEMSAGKVDDLILNQAIDNFSIKSFDKSLDIKDFDLSFGYFSRSLGN